MALACLACHSMENSTDSFRMGASFRTQNMSVSSTQSDEGCAPACFSKKPSPSSARRKDIPGHPSPASASPKPITVFGRRAGMSLDRMVFPEPRLTRCHAVRRDLFSNWTVSEMEAEFRG